jgi:hypothetical protein
MKNASLRSGDSAFLPRSFSDAMNCCISANDAGSVTNESLSSQRNLTGSESAGSATRIARKMQMQMDEKEALSCGVMIKGSDLTILWWQLWKVCCESIDAIG